MVLKDEYVEKVFYYIFKLVIEEGLVIYYFDIQFRNGKFMKEVVRLIWIFIRKFF